MGFLYSDTKSRMVSYLLDHKYWSAQS